MLEWTGERFLPWIGESTIAYEHLHRYAYASTLVKDKRVVDLACGEGYGAKILAAGATSVVGIDIDENVIRHASEKYGSDNIRFLRGSITAVPLKDDHSVDVVVCFEAIEHIDNHEALLAEVKRILTPNGTFVVSTPNKAIYHDESKETNPFHVKELYYEEFREILARHFRSLRFLGQQVHPGSSIWPIGEASVNAFHEFVVEHGNSEFHFLEGNKRVPLYFIAVASDQDCVISPSGSILLDESDSLFKENVRELERQVRERAATIASLEQALNWREAKISELEAQIGELQKGVEWAQKNAKELEQTNSSQREALSWRAVQVSELETGKQYWERETVSRIAEFERVEKRLDEVRGILADVQASFTWKLMMKLRTIGGWFRSPDKSRSGDRRHLP
jgi:SAM-dependent methyltransferase